MSLTPLVDSCSLGSQLGASEHTNDKECIFAHFPGTAICAVVWFRVLLSKEGEF